MLHMVCLNVRKTYASLLDDVLGQVPHRLTFHAPPDDPPGSGPASRARWGNVYGSLREFMRARVASWQDDEPLVLLARDSGNGFVRRWLRQDEDRELVNALVLVDALHGTTTPPSHFGEEFAGVVEFARDCLVDPGQKMLLAVSKTAQAGSAQTVGFEALLRNAVWSAAAPGETADTRQADNIDLLDFPALDGSDLPLAAVALLRSRLVPFATELGPASAPEPPLL